VDKLVDDEDTEDVVVVAAAAILRRPTKADTDWNFILQKSEEKLPMFFLIRIKVQKGKMDVFLSCLL